MPVLDESAARTASAGGNPNLEGDYNVQGAFFLIDITALSGTSPTLTVRVQYTIDGVTWHDLDTTNAQTTALNATGKTVLKVYPGLTAAANAACNSPLPPVHRLAWTIGGSATPTVTFSTAATYLF